MGKIEGETISWVKTIRRREHSIEKKTKVRIQHYFFFNVRLRIDSSSKSVRQQSLHKSLSVFADDDDACEVEGAGAGAGASTSTTLTTARPSRTLRTFSASHCLVAEVGEPEKASQNALPSLLKSVWLAIAAAAACSLDGS